MERRSLLKVFYCDIKKDYPCAENICQAEYLLHLETSESTNYFNTVNVKKKICMNKFCYINLARILHFKT